MAHKVPRDDDGPGRKTKRYQGDERYPKGKIPLQRIPEPIQKAFVVEVWPISHFRLHLLPVPS